MTTAQVSARNAMRTPQFWCLWVVLCMNVTAGIGILEKAAPMIGGLLRATPAPPSAASAAAGFVALLSPGQHDRPLRVVRRPPTSSAARTCTASTWAWAR